MTYKPIQHAFVHNLKVFGPTKLSYRSKKLENFLLGHVGKWDDGGRSFAPKHGCRNVNVWRFYEL